MSRPNRRIEVYDTTLRDGSQAEGVSLSVQDKLLIAEALDALGVDYVEGGYPLSNPKDQEFFREASRRTFRNARVAAWWGNRGSATNGGKSARNRSTMMRSFVPSRYFSTGATATPHSMCASITETAWVVSST